ncbi:Imm52 family immunity protein [Jannaschia marina]|uniref:Imm52 family immunity protein n=1 Tax=Jannaschia marina TaxID=2741674 RepID=UPI0015C9A5F1|nr:Imm52 family immunity protein [Jannaschia marina]
METVMDIWNFDWIVAQPTMYIGLSRQLFPDRRSFGWMGWMPEHLAETGDALAAVESMRGGTFMLLQERMMNLKKPDIEACNRAEAHLLDHGVLKMLG